MMHEAIQVREKNEILCLLTIETSSKAVINKLFQNLL